MADLTPEKASLRSPEKQAETKLIVQQPPKMKELGQLLETLEGLTQRVSERTAEDTSTDLGGSSSGAGAGTGQKSASPRDTAIARMPSSPAVLQKELQQHIEKEIETLEKQVKVVSRATKAGGAFELNELYSRIRRLRSLLHHIYEASMDMLKRLFIRVFIDKQPIL